MSDKEIRITNVNPNLKRELKNISSNLRVDLGQFLKVKLKEIADGFPPEMKKAKKD